MTSAKRNYVKGFSAVFMLLVLFRVFPAWAGGGSAVIFSGGTAGGPGASFEASGSSTSQTAGGPAAGSFTGSYGGSTSYSSYGFYGDPGSFDSTSCESYRKYPLPLNTDGADINFDRTARSYYTYRYLAHEVIDEATYDAVCAQCDQIEANPCDAFASSLMTTVTVPVWRLRNGQKVPDTASVTMLSGVADQFVQIMTEIYNGPQQFPIQDIGGYGWRDNGLSSQHSWGLAVDINWDSNPQQRQDGTVLVGSKWAPGVDPCSMAADSDPVRIFMTHGWFWGASYTTEDYMHFSYF